MSSTRPTKTRNKPKPPSWRRLRKQTQEHTIDLFFLDESGFAPTLPVGSTWARKGVRPLVAYEAPQGRRINVVAALAPFSNDGERLVYQSRKKSDGPYTATVHLSFVRRLAGLPEPLPEGYQRSRPCVIVQDNYGLHISRSVKEQKSALEHAGVALFQLPPYSPKMNPIETLWRQVKYHDLPIRSHKTDQDLQDAVDQALAQRAALLKSQANLSGPA